VISIICQWLLILAFVDCIRVFVCASRVGLHTKPSHEHKAKIRQIQNVATRWASMLCLEIGGQCNMGDCRTKRGAMGDCRLPEDQAFEPDIGIVASSCYMGI